MPKDRMRSQSLHDQTFEHLTNSQNDFDLPAVIRQAHETLESIYITEFPTSEAYRSLVVRLHDNVIEFSFLQQAGMLK
jgi:uncharacterized protein (DUF1778 family)